MSSRSLAIPSHQCKKSRNCIITTHSTVLVNSVPHTLHVPTIGNHTSIYILTWFTCCHWVVGSRIRSITHIPRQSYHFCSPDGILCYTYTQALNYKKCTTANDVWSFGVVIYVWSLGHKPNEGYTNPQVILLH